MRNTDYTTIATDVRVGDSINRQDSYGRIIVTRVTESLGLVFATGISTRQVSTPDHAALHTRVFNPGEPVTIVRTAEIDSDFADCLLIDSIGAIGHWSDVESAVEAKPGRLGRRIVALHIRDHGGDGGTGERRTVDIDTLRLGAELLLTGDTGYAGNGSKDALDKLRLSLATGGQDGDYDAFDCDALVQLGLFHHIRYS